MALTESERARDLTVREICRILEEQYHSPRHGNPMDPLDELVYIILSTRTREPIFQSTYLALRRAFPMWEQITPDNRGVVEAILVPAGLGRLKARQIVAIIEVLRAAFGRATLNPLSAMSDDDAEGFLRSLPGVSRKVAKCVLMYSLDRRVLPVDTHVHRIASRLGWPVKRRPDTSQDLIEAAVPSELRYSFHVNAVAHARAVCLPRRPRCPRCCLSGLCAHAATKGGGTLV